MSWTNRGLGVGVCCLALFAAGCGDDEKDSRPSAEESAGGAADTPEPALVRSDCASTTSALALSQPEGADVWGGLVLIEFDVEGAKVRNFDVQVFDPSLDAWLNSYVEYGASGQREDGSYFIAARPYYNDANKDAELRLRVRPIQDGCPNAEWTESEGFTAQDPVASTSWVGEVPAQLINGAIDVQRSLVMGGGPLTNARLEITASKLQVDFGKKGEISETLTVKLKGTEGAPFDGCTVALTFSGTYELLMRSYGNISLAISEQTLSSTEGTSCDLPTVEELALSSEEFDMPLAPFSQGVNVDYQKTLWKEPGAPFWLGAFSRVFEVLPQYLSYATETEQGVSSGYVSPQELTLVKQ